MVEVPLLFEKGLENWFDFTVCVTTGSATQLRRLEQRGIPLELARQRLVKQLEREALSYVVEPKIDGLAVSVTYEKGRLTRAVTRGNGEEGDDITKPIPGLCGTYTHCLKCGAGKDPDRG